MKSCRRSNSKPWSPIPLPRMLSRPSSRPRRPAKSATGRSSSAPSSSRSASARRRLATKPSNSAFLWGGNDGGRRSCHRSFFKPGVSLAPLRLSIARACFRQGSDHLAKIKIPMEVTAKDAKHRSTDALRLVDKIEGHPEQAPRGRRRGGAQSKDPVECKTDALALGVLARDASTPFRPRLRPRRNSAQHDLDFECGTSQTPLPCKLTSNRMSMDQHFGTSRSSRPSWSHHL